MRKRLTLAALAVVVLVCGLVLAMQASIYRCDWLFGLCEGDCVCIGSDPEHSR